ncbi:FmdB family zinc ribbon protein [Arthrobacter luteolus]|uniref:FmdB family zinc ribbon protein n=1 Tax=Arthrobacter luteolus TaxID=98672 RepID=UPI0009FAA4BA
MATYVFCCPDCAEFELLLPMSELVPVLECPQCGLESRRVYTAPALTGTHRATDRARNAAEASAESPSVVRSLPPGAGIGNGQRWSPFTGAAPRTAGQRGSAQGSGPYQPLPRP